MSHLIKKKEKQIVNTKHVNFLTIGNNVVDVARWLWGMEATLLSSQAVVFNHHWSNSDLAFIIYVYKKKKIICDTAKKKRCCK